LSNGALPTPDRAELAKLLDRASRLDAKPEVVEEVRRVVNAIFAQHQDRIYRVCLRFVGEPQAARELAQETFLTAYRRLAHYEGTGSFFSWLYGIARFKSYNAIQKHKDVLTSDGILEEADPTRGVYYDLRRSERLAVLQAASAAVLDPIEQETVYLRYARGMGQDRITEVLGLTDKSGARGVLQRCRRKLSRELRRRLLELGHSSSFFRETQV
jgi:RNA polymerase sigma-70 factor (ECF subfamily)